MSSMAASRSNDVIRTWSDSLLLSPPSTTQLCNSSTKLHHANPFLLESCCDRRTNVQKKHENPL